uniref:Uncharacterized protein LOC111119229 isoform X2 n=1 Tax=Crassostrea virginica TaxID=6565 RepID=A0A8B8CGG8_CRAVI|nr:uncharacterized protein LOC111119229 isoform X2 [Crassostrea virginica]
MESPGFNHRDLGQIGIVMEELLQKCCMQVDGIHLSQNESKPEEQVLDQMQNNSDSKGDMFNNPAESSCSADEGKRKEGQQIELLQLKDSLSGNGFDRADQKEEGFISEKPDIDKEGPNTFTRICIGENQESNQNDLQKGSPIQKNSFVDIQNGLNLPSTTMILNSGIEEKKVTGQEMLERATSSESQESSFNMNNDQLVKECDDKNEVEDTSYFSRMHKEEEKNIEENNVLKLETLCSYVLNRSPAEIQDITQPKCLETLALRHISDQKPESLKTLAPRHNDDQKDCPTQKVESTSTEEKHLDDRQTDTSISMLFDNVQEKDLNFEFYQNLPVQMRTQALEKTVYSEKDVELGPLEMTSINAAKLGCEKMTFVQSLGLSPLLCLEKEHEADMSSMVTQQLQCLLPAENMVTLKEIDTQCTENEVFGKTEIEKELHLEMEETIPFKKRKLEEYASDKVCQSSKNEVDVWHSSFARDLNPTAELHSELMANTPVDIESAWNSNITVCRDEERSDHIAAQEYAEPQIKLQTEASNTLASNTLKAISNTKGDMVSFDHDLKERVDLNEREDTVVKEVPCRFQVNEQLVPSIINTEQTLTEDAESFYEEENPKSEQSVHLDGKDVKDKGSGCSTNVNDSDIDVSDRTKCFKWKYTPSYDTDAVVPDAEKGDYGSTCRIMPITYCKKPIRLGLSRRQNRVASLHPYIKKHQ